MTTQAQQLLEAAFAGSLDLDADASNTPDSTSAADSNAGQQPVDNTAPAADAGSAAQDDEQQAPIASKSGTYTIPYEKLTEARQARDTLKAENDQLRAQLASLSAAQARNLAAAQQDAQARADAGQAPTESDSNLAVAQAAASQGVDVAIFGDFSEEAIAKGVAQLVEQRASALVDAKLNAAFAPFKQREAQLAIGAHEAAIYGAHKDADEVYESAEFKAWMSNQPTYARAAIEHTLAKGTAEQVIEVFSTFKGQTGKGNPANAVSKALANAQQQPPMSLSELPGAAASGAGDVERLAALAGNPAAMMDFMAGLSPEKQTRLMNSVV